MNKIFYKSILKHTEYELPKIKGSKFIGNIFHVQNQKQAKEKVNIISNQYKDARHHCFAYTYGANINFDLFGNIEISASYIYQNDDGEPTNSAGKPILAQIQGHNLHNILLIVTRYFGGTLLGIGGLIQAYSECAKNTISHAKIEEIELKEKCSISFEYNQRSEITQLLKKYDAKFLQEKNGPLATISFEINKGFFSEFQKEVSYKNVSSNDTVLLQTIKDQL